MSKEKSERRAEWSQVAGWYDQLVGDSGSEYHQRVVLPGVLRLLSLQVNQRVIDIACGQGVLCRQLAQKSVEVTGIDVADEMIRLARERGPGNIRYQVSDATEASGLPAGYFNAAACVLAIQNINPLPPVFTAVARILTDGGKFVIVMTHPAFRGAKETSWGWDETQKVQYRRVDRYLIPRKTPIVTHPGSAPTEFTWTYHRPLEDYIKAAARAGLLIDTLEEWPSHKTSDSGPRAPAENVARKEIPLFLAMRAVKASLPIPSSGTPGG
jgi:ubiquinone/menaquinone biosynthesis C-methylase UbiE